MSGAKRLLGGLLDLLFPPKCALCGRLLDRETDLCRDCRKETEEFPAGAPKKHPDQKTGPQFLDSFTAVWYYKGKVRDGILNLKFHYRVDLAAPFGRAVAMKLLREHPGEFDCITWAPVSSLRKFRRGYDQSELIARTVAKELGLPVKRLLKKRRNTRAQSTLTKEQRRANVLGAYVCVNKDAVCGKRVLLIDDVFTTGATAQECAKVLLTAGAKSVACAAVASASKNEE